MELSFSRSDYLQYAEIFESKALDDVTNELSELNDDIIDFAYELAYTRYALAKTERQLTDLREAVRWERECEWLNDLITEQYASVSEIAPEEEEISMSYFNARAAVDALVGVG